jgi:hypothetical protein
MLTRMSDSPSGDPHEPASLDGPGILAGLPRTRPQRASARRTASRARKPSAASPRQPSATSPRQPSATPPRQATKRAPAKARAAVKQPAPVKHSATAYERAPRQGFEAEPDSLGPVQPPGSTELVSSAAELAGELAKAGVATGARVLRDFLARLPG